MKRLIIFAICLVAFGQTLAQESKSTSESTTNKLNNVKMFEFELGAGTIFGLNSSDVNLKSNMGVQIFGELRLNIPDSPFDVSTQLGIATLNRSLKEDNSEVFYNRYGGIFMVFSDYNFRKWKNISPFVGLGFGTAFIDADTPYVYGYLPSESFVLNPRFGAEFFNHLRVTVEYKWMIQEYYSKEISFFGINIGYTFGGGLK